MRFTIHAASRTSEATGATWREMRLEGEEWAVPDVRMKNDLEHHAPHSASTAAIVDGWQEPDSVADAHVFPGGAPGAGLSNMAMSAVLRRMKRHDVTVHGFRSSFRDWTAEATNHPGEVAGLALAHVNKNKVGAAYLRTRLFERRVQLMKDWADFLS